MSIGIDTATDVTQTPAMSSDGRRAVTSAFIANTIPKNRSHDITPSVRILATSTSTKIYHACKYAMITKVIMPEIH